MSSSYEKWKTFDVEEALTALENEDKPEEPNLRLEKNVDTKSGKSSVHIDCVDYKKTKEEVRLDEELKTGVGQLQHTVLKAAHEATRFKIDGNATYKRGKYKQARDAYANGIARMKTASMALPIMSGRLSHRIKGLLIDLHNNLAMASIKNGNYEDAIRCTTEILTHWDSKNCKALYRRGSARKAAGAAEKARDDFRTLLKIDPKNLAAKKALQDLRSLT